MFCPQKIMPNWIIPPNSNMRMGKIRANSTNAWPKATREKYAELHDLDPAAMRPKETAAMKKPDPQEIEVPGRDSTELHLERFFESVRTRTEPFENAEMGHQCATVGHMVNLSYRSHREMRWDADKRRVVEGGTPTEGAGITAAK